MRDVYEFIARSAPADSTVLIEGESGTGKELVARALHRNGRRSRGPFVAINCGALSEELLESELFGHERGAFTGAIAQKLGKLEMANRGTVFLDEVSELPHAVQAKLLRVLQEREFERLGGTQTIRVDVRIIAATNRNLASAVEDRTFRHDLYYRLNVVPLRMPSLRERRDDIPLLATYFARKHGQKMRRRPVPISPEARACLASYDWPGNVRELENAIERAVVMGSGDVIQPEDLPEPILERESSHGPMSYHDGVIAAKKEMIRRALEQAEGNHALAAQLLTLHPNYLYRLITNLNLRGASKGKQGRWS